MMTALWIAAGGAIGTLGRYALAGVMNDAAHPWGTVAVNIAGSLALGLLIGVWGFGHVEEHQLALTIGVLGGFTTFSTFALDTIYLWERGEASLAVATVVISVVVGLAAAVGGLFVGRAVSG